MTYFQFELDPKEEAASRFIGDVGRLLQKALVDRKSLGKLTQQEIAERLGVDRSAVNRCFSGHRRNISLEKLAELCWAMDVEPTLKLEQILNRDKGNHLHEMWSSGGHVRELPRTSSPFADVKVSR